MVLSVKKEKQVPLHHRKRQGNHHKRSKDYDKHYWPYLPLFVVVGIAFGINVLWAPLLGLAKHDVLGYATSTSISGLLDETNTQRTGNGAGTLQLNSLLNQAAQAKANDMVARDYWSHTTPDGKQPWWFVSNTGYNYTTVGENLAYGFDSSNATVNGWMNSASHKANMLNGTFLEVGFGIANSPNYVGGGEETIVVALYGKSKTAVAPANTAKVTPTAVTPVPATTLPAPTPDPIPAAAKPTTNTTTQAPAGSQWDDTVTSAAPQTKTISDQPLAITRMETVAANLPAQGLASSVLAIAAALALVIYRHARALHRKLLYGERFLVHHPLLDIALVGIVSAGTLLTRTAGFIN